MQHWKLPYERMQHGKSGTWKWCNLIKVQCKKSIKQKGLVWEKHDMKKMQHEKSDKSEI